MYSSTNRELFPGFAEPPAAQRRNPALPPRPELLPPGFRYQPDFLSREEEAELLACFAKLELRNSRYQEYTALRRTASFDLAWAGAAAQPDYPQRRAALAGGIAAPAPPAPSCLRSLAARVAAQCSFNPAAFAHALVTEYPPGAPMGWHRDAPPCAEIYGISLAADCRFRLRPLWAASPELDRAARRAAALDLQVQRRSLYVMSGPSRSDWQHAISPVRALRYSITLRTLSRQLSGQTKER